MRPLGRDDLGHSPSTYNMPFKHSNRLPVPVKQTLQNAEHNLRLHAECPSRLRANSQSPRSRRFMTSNAPRLHVADHSIFRTQIQTPSNNGSTANGTADIGAFWQTPPATPPKARRRATGLPPRLSARSGGGVFAVGRFLTAGGMPLRQPPSHMDVTDKRRRAFCAITRATTPSRPSRKCSSTRRSCCQDHQRDRPCCFISQVEANVWRSVYCRVKIPDQTGARELII